MASFGVALLLSRLGDGVPSEEDDSQQAGQRAARSAELAESCRRLKALGDWRRLEREAQAWGALQPERLEPWLMAADAARQQGSVERVARYLSQTPDDCPVAVLVILGQLQLEELNQPLAAVETFKRTLARYPDDLETNLRLLHFYSMTCQREQVIEQARRYIATGKAPPAIFAFLFAARWLVFSNGYDLNKQWLRSGENVELFEVAATVHLLAHPELKAMAQAAQSDLQVPTDYFEHRLRETLKHYPNNRELLAVELRQSAQRGDVIEVSKILANASAECGEDPRFWFYHGWYHNAKGNTEQALQAYRRALEIDRYDWLTWNELATITRRAKGLEAAQPMLETALLGRDVTQAIRVASNMETIPPADFQKLAKYLELCGDSALAQQLKISLEQSHSVTSVTSTTSDKMRGAEH